MEETNTSTVVAAKRPTFLTVLCILSFVGIAFSLIGGIMSYFTYSAMASTGNLFEGMGGTGGEQMEQAMSGAMEAFGIDPGKMAMSSLVVALLNIPILIGVLMMWKQKKSGFYIYTAFELIQAAVPFIIVGGLAGSLTGVMYAIGGIVFIILYGINLKHMS